MWFCLTYIGHNLDAGFRLSSPRTERMDKTFSLPLVSYHSSRQAMAKGVSSVPSLPSVHVPYLAFPLESHHSFNLHANDNDKGGHMA